MVQRLQKKDRSLDILDRIFTDVHFRCFGVDVGEEFPVRERAVGAEFVEDFGKWG